MEIPKEVLKEIAEELETGFKCFVHRETFEIVTFPDPDQFFDMDETEWKEEKSKVKKNKKKFIEVEPMGSRDSFQMMAEFAESLEEGPTQIRLITALQGHKPFANFKLQIDHSGEYRQQWFAFKLEKMMEWVQEQLSTDRL